jgi:hypothetical protein
LNHPTWNARSRGSVIWQIAVRMDRFLARVGGINEGTRAGHSELYTLKGRTEMSSKRYPVMIEKTATGFSAYSPDVIGCVATGDTEEQTRQSFQDAL